MTINALQLNVSTPWAGLGTATYNVLTTGIYTVGISCTIPYVAAGSSDNSTTAATDPAASGLSIVVNNNGTPVYTLSSPSPTQPSLSGKATFSATAGTTITVVFSSSAAADQVANAVKAIINLYSGE